MTTNFMAFVQIFLPTSGLGPVFCGGILHAVFFNMFHILGLIIFIKCINKQQMHFNFYYI